MKVFAVNTLSGKASKSATRSKFRNGSSFGITVPLYHPKNPRSIQRAPWI